MGNGVSDRFPKTASKNIEKLFSGYCMLLMHIYRIKQVSSKNIEIWPSYGQIRVKFTPGSDFAHRVRARNSVFFIRFRKTKYPDTQETEIYP